MVEDEGWVMGLGEIHTGRTSHAEFSRNCIGSSCATQRGGRGDRQRKKEEDFLSISTTAILAHLEKKGTWKYSKMAHWGKIGLIRPLDKFTLSILHPLASPPSDHASSIDKRLIERYVCT